MGKSSQYIGVCNARGRWMAYTGGGNMNKKFHGKYDTEQEAALARNKAMIERFGYDPSPNVIADPPADVPHYSTVGEPIAMIRKLSILRDAGKCILSFRCLPKESHAAMKGRTVDLARFCRTMPYISEVLPGCLYPATIDLDALEFNPQASPWLSADPLPEAEILFHYHGLARPQRMVWQGLYDPCDKRSAFIGSRLQMQVFRTLLELPMLRLVWTRDLIKAARFIKGASLFIGNASVYSSLAKGLGVKTLLEPSKPTPTVPATDPRPA